MDKKGKEWIKKNWHRPVFHCATLIIFFVIAFSILNMWTTSNEASDGWNIFITVAIFGALCWLTLVVIYIDKWSERFSIYKEEYEEYCKKVGE